MKAKKATKAKLETKPMHPVIQGFMRTLGRRPKALPKAPGVPIDEQYLDAPYVQLQQLEKMAAAARRGLELNYAVPDVLRLKKP
jgi:hypothetical protein